MKKLFILTVLLSVANLGAYAPEEAHARLTAAQTERSAALARAKEHEANVKHAFAMAQQKPGKETYAALQAAINSHAQTVDHCSQCVRGIQGALKDINANGHFVHGDAWTGRVHTTEPVAAA